MSARELQEWRELAALDREVSDLAQSSKIDPGMALEMILTEAQRNDGDEV